MEWFARAVARSGVVDRLAARLSWPGAVVRFLGQGVGSSSWGCQPGAGIAVIRSKAAAIWVAQGQV